MGNKDYKEKKITWSKGALLITGIIFIVVIATTIFLYISNYINTITDTALLATCVTVSGAIFGSNLCWYSKKSASENHYKLRMSLFDNATKVRLDYNVAMFEAMKKYNMTQEDLNYVDSTGDIDEMMDSALNSTINNLDEMQSDADSPNTIENFGL